MLTLPKSLVRPNPLKQMRYSATIRIRMITADNKSKAFALTQTHKEDVGSPQAQASVLTTRIKEVTEHLQTNKHDNMARRGLIQMVAKRKKLLKYLEANDFEAYKATVAKLGLRK